MELNYGIKTAKWAKTEVTMRFLVENYPKKVVSRTFCDFIYIIYIPTDYAGLIKLPYMVTYQIGDG